MKPQLPFVSTGRRAGALLAVVAVLLGTATWPTAGSAATTGDASGIVEVGRLPLLHEPTLSAVTAESSGWLIVNSATRRAYEIFETRDIRSRNHTLTVVQSFDLDTLQPRRRAVLAGAPITSGPADVAGVAGTSTAGDIVHAVDAKGRIYIAMSQPANFEHQGAQILGGFGVPVDAQRPISRWVAIDEHVFDSCAGAPGCAFAASFREPAEQARYHYYWVEGMAVNRKFVGRSEWGKLVLVFAQPQPAGAVLPFYDHTVAQWDVSDLDFTAAAAMTTDPDQLTGLSTPGEQPPLTQQVESVGLARQLEVCRTAPLAAAGSHAKGSYQWGLLITKRAVWTACQAGEGAGSVARVDLDDTGHFVQVGGQGSYRMSRPISDTLVDDGAERFLVKSFGEGQTWWVFDTGLERYTGAVAAKASDFYALAAGIDPTTGRLYQQLPDYEGGGVPIRGGFMYSDTRLNPAPSFTNVRPELAYPAIFRITVDPPTRRVFVRRGHGGYSNMHVYPGREDVTPAPLDLFYTVYKDSIPLTEPPIDQDDAVFTTDVPESDLTRASYLGSGSGFGVRAWLVGGLDAAADRRAAGGGPCGKDDRELLAGSVGAVDVSDLSARADAASLDGDGKTQDHLRNPVTRCASESAPTDTRETEFGPEGKNLYRAECTGDTSKDATAPPDKAVSRHNFRAKANCAWEQGSADAEANGAFSIKEADVAQNQVRQDERTPSTLKSQLPEQGVLVGHASSRVSVTREPGKGVTIEVDSIARTVVLPGIGTIGAIRGTATVTATGRPGGAEASYHRTICDVHIGALHHPSCKNETEQAEFEAQMNQAMGSRGRVRFRPPDPVLFQGSPSGYKAGVQRPQSDGFEDVRIARDTSLALPAMELVLYNGDNATGTGRQFFHFAGVQAGASYGIVCLYGQRPDGRCAKDGDTFDTVVDGTDTNGDNETRPGEQVTLTEYVQGERVEVPGGSVTKRSGGDRKSLIRRIVEAPFELVKDVFRLLFANPREFGLMAAVWALLFAPCYLGERRKSIQALRARRALIGGVA